MVNKNYPHIKNVTRKQVLFKERKKNATDKY